MNDSSTTNGRTPDHSGRNSVTPMTFKDQLANVARTSAALVASLNRAFSEKCKFTVLSHTINRQISPELMKVKEKVKGIPAIEFETLSKFNDHIYANDSRLQNYRRDTFLNRAFILNEPESKQGEEVQRMLCWAEQTKNDFGTCGEQAINCHIKTILKSALWIKDEAGKVDSKLRAVRILRENTEYWQGFWDAIKDQVFPDISSAGPKAVQPLLVLVNWAAELIASGIAYNKSWEREKFLQVLDTWEEMLMRDHELILTTINEMSNYSGFMKNAQGLWASAVGLVWAISVDDSRHLRTAIMQYDAYLRELEKANTMLSLTNKPFQQALIQIHPFFGPGISVERNTKDFCEHVPYISIYLKSLLTAKGIIADSQAELFEEKVYDLARIIYGRLETINELCAQWSKSIDPGELATFIQIGNFDFIRGTGQVIQAIKSMLQTETEDRKRKEASKKRMEWDRRYKSWGWNNRPLVTSASAIEVLEDLDTIIKVINSLSVSTGTGTNMLSIGGAAEARRSQVEFNRSNSLLSEFFGVLNAEIERGSMEFPEKKEKEQPVAETKKSRGGVLRRQWTRWWGTKPTAPNPKEELGLI